MHSIQAQVHLVVTNFSSAEGEGRRELARALLWNSQSTVQMLLLTVTPDTEKTVCDIFREMITLDRTVLDILVKKLMNNEIGAKTVEKILIDQVNEHFAYFAIQIGQLREARQLEGIRQKLIDIARRHQTKFFDLLDVIAKNDKHGLLLEIAIKASGEYSVDIAGRLIIELKFEGRRRINEAILTEMAKGNSSVYSLMSRWKNRDDFDRREILRRILANADAGRIREEPRRIERPRTRERDFGHRPFEALRGLRVR